MSNTGYGMILMLLLLCAGGARADNISIAVASNFANTLKDIAALFEQQSSHRVTLVHGSTGKHYAQIRHGAPFEVFFAADVERPRLLEEQGIAQPGSRFTYALGKLVLWSPVEGKVDREGRVLIDGDFYRLAIANPGLAPYGRAAEQILRLLGAWDLLQSRIVRGENIGQAYQFVSSGNAQLGFVAYSQLKQSGPVIGGSYWDVPQSMYAPIEQQAVLLKDNDAAHEFLAFIKSRHAMDIIRAHGYGVP